MTHHDDITDHAVHDELPVSSDYDRDALVDDDPLASRIPAFTQVCHEDIDPHQRFGIDENGKPDSDDNDGQRRLYINLKLASSGQPTQASGDQQAFLSTAGDLLQSYREKARLLSSYLCPPDQRIQDFIDRYLGPLAEGRDVRLPSTTLVLDRHGVARELSLPADGDEFHSEFIDSYRVHQGVLHNPVNDRRTTKGFFHIVEGGMPIPGDKKAVPVGAFARMLELALHPSDALLQIPFSANQEQQAAMFVSLLLRPEVRPARPDGDCRKTMEIRFLAPGSLVANLDFVESIFGNAGNPFLPENDAALDIERWTGHTGGVIIAPQLLELTKKELGLPHVDDATERQRADGMCWQQEDELYNDGQPFKVTARDSGGVILTLVTDNYFGYCKKEVKTQISFAANLYGDAEEEHAGGALAFAQRNHGNVFGLNHRRTSHTFAEVLSGYASRLELHPQGHATDRRHPDLVLVPEDTRIDLVNQRVSWEHNGKEQTLRLDPEQTYMLPNGYKVQMQKYPGASSWRLVGTDAEGTFCHKPCTVSGGGKSEISKSIAGSILYKPLFVNDLEEDLDEVQKLIDRDYSDRFLDSGAPSDQRRPLSAQRSLGSVIKLLTPSPENYTPEYNAWLETIPSRIRSLLFLVKRFYRPEWGDRWREHFSVDIINGVPGHELKFNGRPIASAYLRVGFEPNGAWRIFKLRQDFVAAVKVQMEDDITASTVVPSTSLPNAPEQFNFPAAKVTTNCEFRLFQRPDDAIHRGLDQQTEADFTRPANFLANYEPLDRDQVNNQLAETIAFDQYSAPMQDLLREAAADGTQYTVSSAQPRLVNGKPTKNPRYLQLRPDVDDPFATYVAEMGLRLHRRVPDDEPVCNPVDAVLTGRRNNPPEPASGVRSLAVYNPIHYQELPELFMDFICSLTGKSPSTTGAGSEGALTKGPFNALRPIIDLNNTLVSYILTDYPGFSSAAGHIGPNMRVDHDISMLVPEIWARLPLHARDPQYLIDKGYLEPVQDFEQDGRPIAASRLGYRITASFVHAYLGRIFDSPNIAFDQAILQPETQDMDSFVDGIDNIVEAQRRVARTYLEDGSIDDACPPLYALLHIMADDHYQGKGIHDPAIRALFERDNMMASDWYQARLLAKQRAEQRLWTRHIAYLEQFQQQSARGDQVGQLKIAERIERAHEHLVAITDPDFPKTLRGTLGTDPSCVPAD